MPAAEPKVDMLEFLATLRGQRYRAFIVHAPPRKGKSTFARALAKAANGAYIDVLATIAADPDLAAKIDVLDPPALKDFALKAANDASVVMVDEFDLLLPIWGGDIKQLSEIVRKLSVTETAATIGFIMRTLPAIESLEITTTTGQTRVLSLDEIQALK